MAVFRRRIDCASALHRQLIGDLRRSASGHCAGTLTRARHDEAGVAEIRKTARLGSMRQAASNLRPRSDSDDCP
jgi:hypothetical protein